MQLGKDGNGNVKTFFYDLSYCREEMIDNIVSVKQPFNTMKIHEFSDTIQRAINPQFKGWFGNIVKKYIMKKFHTQTENYKNYFTNFEGNTCLTTDT